MHLRKCAEYRGYFFCEEVTLASKEPRRYRVVPLAILPYWICQALRRQAITEVEAGQYSRQRYTCDELVAEAWRQEYPHVRRLGGVPATESFRLRHEAPPASRGL